MIIKFTDTIWLNVEADEVTRIDIDTRIFENMRETACYFVTITFRNGTTEQSDYFKTFEEARICAEKFLHALDSEE